MSGGGVHGVGPRRDGLGRQALEPRRPRAHHRADGEDGGGVRQVFDEVSVTMSGSGSRHRRRGESTMRDAVDNYAP